MGCSTYNMKNALLFIYLHSYAEKDLMNIRGSTCLQLETLIISRHDSGFGRRCIELL